MGQVNPYKKKVSIVPLLRKILEIQLRIIEKAEPLIPPVLIFCFLYKVAKTLWRLLKMQKNIGWGMTLEYFLCQYFSWIPYIRNEITAQKKEIAEQMSSMFVSEDPTPHTIIPRTGLSKETILMELQRNREEEVKHIKNGTMFTGTYLRGNKELKNIQKEVFYETMKTNSLYITNLTSIRKFESEISSMVVNMLHGTDECCGVMTSGGTESVLMAMKAYRDFARKNKKVKKGRLNIVASDSAHCAFHKAADYFGMDIKFVKTKNGHITVDQVKKQIDKRTVVVVCSAPSYSHGIIDPVEEIAALCSSYGIGCHVDNCLGGFLLSFLDNMPLWDFQVPGVTSISSDVHKFGGSIKGCSVVAYRTNALRRSQYYIGESWSGGIVFTTGFQGSRNGGLSAVGWATILNTGLDGYKKQAMLQQDSFQKLLSGLVAIPEIDIIGEPKAIMIAFCLKDLDCYQLADCLEKKFGTFLVARLQFPKCLHIVVADSLLYRPEKLDEMLEYIQQGIEEIKINAGEYEKGAALYGSAATIPSRDLVGDCVSSLVDHLLTVN